MRVITFVATVAGMVHELKLRKIGNSVGLVLPKDALEHLQAGEGDTVMLSESVDRGFRLHAAKDSVSAQMKVAQSIMERYRHTLRELAK